MSEKLKQMRAAKRAAKENSQREMDKLDRELCKAFAAAESAGSRSAETRPARNKGKDFTDRFAGGFEMWSNTQPVSTDSAEAARERMNQAYNDPDRSLQGINAYQAKLVRQRRNGEIPD